MFPEIAFSNVKRPNKFYPNNFILTKSLNLLLLICFRKLAQVNALFPINLVFGPGLGEGFPFRQLPKRGPLGPCNRDIAFLLSYQHRVMIKK